VKGGSEVPQLCKRCQGRGDAHFLTCPYLTLEPGWYDRVTPDEVW